MVEVRLHGTLARDYGKVWNLDIHSPAEAVAAIDCARPGFRAALLQLAEAGQVFRVRSRNHDYGNEDVGLRSDSLGRVDIIPLVVGASAGVRFVVGAVLYAASFYADATSGTGTFLRAAGTSLMLGSVVEWLTPKVKRSDMQDQGLQSWGISGPTNTVDQGMPVPVIYGEVLTGGYTISAGISTSKTLIQTGAVVGVNFGGEVDYPVRLSQDQLGQTITVVVSQSASPYNLDDPITYAWTYSGFTRAAAVRVRNADQATVEIEVDYVATNPGAGVQLVLDDTGTLTAQVSGMLESGRSLNTTVLRTYTASKQVRIALVTPVFGV